MANIHFCGGFLPRIGPNLGCRDCRDAKSCVHAARSAQLYIRILSFIFTQQIHLHLTKHASNIQNGTLVLDIPPSALEDINWNFVGDGMVNLLDKNLIDKELKNWITPTYSTTTRTDRTVSAMLVMACMKKYSVLLLRCSAVFQTSL
jgi:Domain of unknown function (DUF4419)